MERGAVNAAGLLSDDLSSSAVAWCYLNTLPALLTSTPGDGSSRPALTLPQLWPTPMEHDHWMSNNPRSDGRQNQLPNVAALFCDHPKRRLNPLFTEWLMGWPIGWSDCGRPATESYLTWLASRG